MARVALATIDMRLYFEIAKLLRRRGVVFKSLTPGDSFDEELRLVLTGEDEVDEINRYLADKSDDSGKTDTDDTVKIRAIGVNIKSSDWQATVDRELAVLRVGNWQRLIVGVDPGRRFGLAVVVNDIVVWRGHIVGVDAAVNQVCQLLSQYEAEEQIIRLGSGAQLLGWRFAKKLWEESKIGFSIELVDEYGSSKEPMRKKKREVDVAAAEMIAQTPGKQQSMDKWHVEPNRGDLQWVQKASRKMTKGQVALDEELAKKVALGELDLKEALMLWRKRRQKHK